jgi:hypothetical protein
MELTKKNTHTHTHNSSQLLCYYISFTSLARSLVPLNADHLNYFKLNFYEESSAEDQSPKIN